MTREVMEYDVLIVGAGGRMGEALVRALEVDAQTSAGDIDVVRSAIDVAGAS